MAKIECTINVRFPWWVKAVVVMRVIAAEAMGREINRDAMAEFMASHAKVTVR